MLLTGSGETYGNGDPAVIAAHFNGQAPNYLKACLKVGWDLSAKIVEILEEENILFPGQIVRILDGGAGTGELGRNYKAFHGNHADVTGVDIATKMMEIGTQNGWIDTPIVGSITEPQVEPATQHLFTSVGVFDFIKPGAETEAAIREIRSALKDGGVFAINVEPDGTQSPGKRTYKHNVAGLKAAFEEVGFTILREERVSNAHKYSETGAPVENVILIGQLEPRSISSFYLNQLSGPGFAFEATPEALGIELKEPATPYVTASGARASGDTEIRSARATLARPALLAESVVLPPDAHTISHNAVFVKRKGSHAVALPECFSFAASMAKVVAQDLLELYGPELFERCDIELVVKRAALEPGEALRPEFSGWHDHMTKGFGTDLIYGFSDILPTEFKTPDGKIHVPPEHSLVRFGAEEIHRSQTNPTDKTLRRTWGAFVVSFDQKPKNGTSSNHAMGALEKSLERSKRHRISHLKTLPKGGVPLEELTLAG